MSRFRSHWLAVFGGATLIALSASSAFAHHPDTGANPGMEVSAFVHSMVGDVEEPTEPADQPTDQTNTTAPSDHGACVSAVAMGDEVGGDQNNHGGAVSEAARVTCWPDATAPKTDQQSNDQGDNKDQTTDSPEADTDAKDATTQSGSDHHHGGHDNGGSGSDS